MFTIDIGEMLQILSRGENENVEFKKKPDIVGIAETICAFSNTNGGMLFIGVDDKGRLVGVASSVARNSIAEAISAVHPYPRVDIEMINIGNREIVVVKVAKSEKIHSFRGRVYIRIGASNRPLSLEEIVEKAAESLLLRFDELPSNASVNDLNLDFVEKYFKTREKIRSAKMLGSLDENMKIMKIIVEKNGKYVPSNAGLLFFSDMPQRWIPQSKVHLVWFEDEEMKKYVDMRFFEGPLWKIIDELEEYFYAKLRRIGGELLGWRRVEIIEYPIRALREAITNAIVHRNYFDTSEIKIFVTPSRIMIRNPGSFPPGVTPDNPIHKPRNPLIAQYMYDLGYIEKYGYGIRMMKEECEKHPLVRLEFRIRPYITEVIFHKTIKTDIVDEMDEKIVEKLRKHRALSSGELSQMLGVSKPTIIRHLKKLEALGIIESRGRGPAKRYVIKTLL